MNNFPLCYIFLQFFPQFVFFLSFLPSAATPLSSQAPLPLSFRPSESPCYSAQGLSLSFRKRSLPSVIFLASEAISLSFRESEASREIFFLLHFGAAAASLTLSFRASAASREICFEPGVGAALGFQAATGGAPFGCAALRPLPESPASSLRDNPNLSLPGPFPLPSPGVDMSALWQLESFIPQRSRSRSLEQFT